MSAAVRKLLKVAWLAAGGLVVLVALGAAAFHLLAHELPSYRAELKAWVQSELGLELDFARVAASWSWFGPELAFGDVNVRAIGDETPFLTARAASVGLNVFDLVGQLVSGADIGVDRLTVEGTELTLIKTEAGGYRLQGVPSQSGGSSSIQVPPDVDVLVRDSRVLYLDPQRSVAWDFQDFAGSMRRDGAALTVAASARPPREFASRIEISARGVIATDRASPTARFTGDWRVSADVEEIDLAGALVLLPPQNVVPKAGHGHAAVRLEWRGGALSAGEIDLSLLDVSLQGEAEASYERIGFTGNWERTGDTWQVALRDIAVVRGGRAWPEGSAIDLEIERVPEGEHLALRSTFLRLEDVTPLLAPLEFAPWLDSWRTLNPRGDLRNFDFALTRPTTGRTEYAIAGAFTALSVEPLDEFPGVRSLSGDLRADQVSGRLELATTASTLDWPALFRGPLELPELRGILVWRAGQDAVRVVSDDLVVATRDATLRSNLELTLPMDGSSPELDLRTDVSAFDIAAVQRYLPANKMPPTVVAWLDDALSGGRVERAEVTFVGPVRAFPFDDGEGSFRATALVEEAELAFVHDWPHAQELYGTVEFVNASFEAHGRGRILGNRAADLRVRIADLREGMLTLQTSTQGPLDQVLLFLNEAPLIARYLGPDFARLEAPAGTAAVHLDLDLPLRDREAYQITAGVDVADAELTFRGFGPRATEVNGSLALADGVLRGSGIQAIFLDGPVTASVDAARAPGYRARLDLDGEITIDAVVAAFDLPYGDRLAGQTRWQGTLLIPEVDGNAGLPPRITVHSNLSGVALRFPEPFAKPPSEPTNLEVDMQFPTGMLAMTGYVGATRRFALELDGETDGGYRFRRAALQFGGALPEFRADRGLTLDGNLPRLHLDEWLALSRGAAGSSGGRGQWSGALAGANLAVADFAAFGQQLGSTRITARRRTDDWQFDLDSNAIAGTLLVPMDLEAQPRIVAVMRRMYLSAGSGGAARENAQSVDPRELPGLQLHADEFGIGQRQFGRLDAEILADPLGLRLVSFESATNSFTAQGSGGWFVGAGGQTTRLAVSVNATNVASMLNQLGFAPFVEAERAEVTASVYWPGPPSGSWLDHLGGDLALRAETGSLIDVAPGGAGRVLGLLSFSALPRRLALDFRDVFNRGFVFDEITADFAIIDGNAYTDNLKLTGPVAEVGIIGRTGLRDRDYRQQAVITSEPGRLLPTVGALIGGPTVAAALLIFTRIFKKPLDGIGRASYCLTGSWQEPTVERLTDEQLKNGELCAELPPNGLPRPAVQGAL